MANTVSKQQLICLFEKRYLCHRRKNIRTWDNAVKDLVSDGGSSENTMSVCWLVSGEVRWRLF